MSTNISLSDTTSSLNATLTFPDHYSAVVVSNRPNYNFKLPTSTGIPDRPFAKVCIWFHSTPANITFSDRDTNDTLQLERVDGVDIDPRRINSGDRFAVDHDALLRWMIVFPEEAILFLPTLRKDPNPGYAPEQTFSTFFVAEENVTYFDPPPPSETPEATETPLETEDVPSLDEEGVPQRLIRHG
jgi:hypothetical protein